MSQFHSVIYRFDCIYFFSRMSNVQALNKNYIYTMLLYSEAFKYIALIVNENLVSTLEVVRMMVVQVVKVPNNKPLWQI